VNEWTVAIGVDTHKQAHVAVALDRLGVRIDSCSVTATPAGYRRLFCMGARAWRPDLRGGGMRQLRRRFGAFSPGRRCADTDWGAAPAEELARQLEQRGRDRGARVYGVSRAISCSAQPGWL